MSTVTERAGLLREVITTNRAALTDVLSRYGADNPRIVGSVARGDAGATSDIDLLVDLEPDGGNALLRIGGGSARSSAASSVSGSMWSRTRCCGSRCRRAPIETQSPCEPIRSVVWIPDVRFLAWFRYALLNRRYRGRIANDRSLRSSRSVRLEGDMEVTGLFPSRLASLAPQGTAPGTAELG